MSSARAEQHKVSDRKAQGCCHRKKFHPNRKAGKVARDIAAAESGIPMSVYHCPVCSGWHICKRDNVPARPTTHHDEDDASVGSVTH